jgi:hypothetical protein
MKRLIIPLPAGNWWANGRAVRRCHRRAVSPGQGV